MFHVTDVKTGICPLCRGTKERELFVVSGAGFSGDVCGRHLFILVRQQPATEPGKTEKGNES